MRVDAPVAVCLAGFEELLGSIDTLVTPGNSYGQMDGGLRGSRRSHVPGSEPVSGSSRPSVPRG
jgi:hypothetical protein